MRASSVIGMSVVLTALGTSAALLLCNLRRIRVIHRLRLVRLRQILKELRHGY